MLKRSNLNQFIDGTIKVQKLLKLSNAVYNPKSTPHFYLVGN